MPLLIQNSQLKSKLLDSMVFLRGWLADDDIMDWYGSMLFFVGMVPRAKPELVNNKRPCPHWASPPDSAHTFSSWVSSEMAGHSSPKTSWSWTKESSTKQGCVKNVLKTLDTIGNCQRLVFTLAVSQHMHKTTVKISVKIWAQSVVEVARIMKEKIPSSHEVVCVQMLDFETSNSKSEVSKSIRWKLLLSRKLHYFRGSCFSQMFYTTNLSPLFVTK